MKPEWRKILELRSVKDKLAIPVDCDILEPGDLNIVTELVHENLMVWIDRAMLPMVAVSRDTGMTRIGINSDIYMLTAKGIKLCNDNGIKQR